MQNTSNKFSSSIVWTNTNDYIDALSNFENAKLASVLNDKTENVIGGISKIYSKQSFPISAHINSIFISKTQFLSVTQLTHSTLLLAKDGTLECVIFRAFII